MRSIELFTGAGGLALGIHRAGFHHEFVLEYNHDASDTLRLNTRRYQQTNVSWPIKEADVTTFDYGPYGTDIDLLAAGAPCQPWSLGGKHGGKDDRRNLFPEAFRAVRALRPRALLLENVRGITREAFRPYFDYILAQAHRPSIEILPWEIWEAHKERILTAERGEGDTDDCYEADWVRYNAADFGVPQERHRVFIVAFRRDLDVRWEFPRQTHSSDALLYAQYVDGSYWEEHGVKPRPVPDRLLRRVHQLSRESKPETLRWRTVRDAISNLPEPIDYVPNLLYDNHVGIPDARPYPGHTGSPWDWPAKTIKAGDHGNPGGENMLRRDDGTVRYFTTRELARLQTFPDEWHFANSWTETRRQLGNAVPVTLAERLARQMYESLTALETEAIMRDAKMVAV